MQVPTSQNESNQSSDLLVFSLPSVLSHLKSNEMSVLHVLDEIENSHLISIPFCSQKIQLVGCMCKS